MYVYGLCLLFDFATKNFHLAALQAHLSRQKKNLKGRTLHDLLHEGLMNWTARFQYFTLLQKEKEKKSMVALTI